MSHRPVCVKCKVELIPDKNGVKVVDMFLKNQSPYQIWDADRWICPECGIQIITGFGKAPLYQHFWKDFRTYFDSIKDDPNTLFCKEPS